MAQQLQTQSISAPGFLGLNTENSPLDLQAGFALVANNCVIDQYGRIAARKGWAKTYTSVPAALGSNDVNAVGELITSSGTAYILQAGNNKLFKTDLSGATCTELTYGGGGVAPVISGSDWMMASLSNCMYFFQEGHDPLVFDPTVSTTAYRRVSEKTGYAGTIQSSGIAISAFGRLWTASTSADKVTVQFSDLKSGHIYTGGSAGTLDVSSVWPKGGDNITGLAAHNNFLFIFGKNCILVYSGANTPSTMTLYDTIVGIGCVSRFSVQNTENDVWFLSDSGVRSVMRTIQEKSAPFRDLSRNIRKDIIVALSGETNPLGIKAVYSPLEGFYLLSFPALKTVYCFNTKTPADDGSAKVTTWTLEPKSFCYVTSTKDTLFGMASGVLAKHTGYQDDPTATSPSYRFQYYTNHTDLGAPTVTSILKKLLATVIGASNQSIAIKWAYDFTSNYRTQTVTVPLKGVAYFGTSEYNVSGSEYSIGVNMEELKVHPTGSGVVVQCGFEADINGGALSIQKIIIESKNGRLAP